MDDNTVTPTEAPANTEAAATTEAPAKKASPIRASGLALVLADGTELKPIKYPMPIRAPRSKVTINDTEQEAAQTTFKDILYTYFTFGGASFYVPGHLDLTQSFKLKFNEGYTFAPTKMDRKVAASKAAEALKAKKASAPASDPAQNADAGPASGDAGGDAGGEVPTPPEAAEAAAPAPKKGKKASR